MRPRLLLLVALVLVGPPLAAGAHEEGGGTRPIELEGPAVPGPAYFLAGAAAGLLLLALRKALR